MTLPEGRLGKALALGICGVLLALVYLSVVGPLLTLYADMREELQDLDSQRAHLARVEAELPRLRATVADLKRRSTGAGLLLPDANDAVAAASLQAKLQALAAANGAEISSVENLPARPQDGFRRIGVRPVIAGSIAAVGEILAALERAQPPLLVDNLEIRNNGIPSRQDPTKSPPLHISFDVYGFRGDQAQVAETQ